MSRNIDTCFAVAIAHSRAHTANSRVGAHSCLQHIKFITLWFKTADSTVIAICPTDCTIIANIRPNVHKQIDVAVVQNMPAALHIRWNLCRDVSPNLKTPITKSFFYNFFGLG